ncbi:MAG: antibiotic biosynthesis monooxygenase [Saprospiraceae bacterium]|jgi:heme-degrading monooxygenase HmoA|nr:antibiotic biosynthesis monooxygenase [Saprospiraceae bacterium]
MIKRIVKLTFQKDKVEDFIQIFETSKHKIRQFPGCQHLELWHARQPSNVFFTYSYWDSEEDLNKYRYSDLFKATWAKTKILFSDKPAAWSVDVKSKIDINDCKK